MVQEGTSALSSGSLRSVLSHEYSVGVIGTRLGQGMLAAAEVDGVDGQAVPAKVGVAARGARMFSWCAV
jgi:hypothetical protein